MSALGQKQTLTERCGASALPPKADIGTQSRNVRFVPKADSCTAAIVSNAFAGAPGPSPEPMTEAKLFSVTCVTHRASAAPSE
jgi:hypothetical protein